MDSLYALLALFSLIAVPIVAKKKKRNPFLFLILTFVVGPFAFLPLYISRKKKLPIPSPVREVFVPSDAVSISVEYGSSMPTAPYVEPEDAREAACPSCGGVLKKVPGAKTKCPHCGEFMFVRTDPTSNTRVVVTAEQAEAIEDEWAKVNGTWEDRQAEKDRFARIKAELSKQFGTTASDADVNWRILNEDSIAHASMQDWGLYRNTIFQMGEHLRKEGKLKAAIEKYLLVCYIDTCGPNNVGTPIGQKNEWGQKPFSKSEAFLAPGVTGEIAKAATKSGMVLTDIKAAFMEMAAKYKNAVPFTITPETSWREIEKELDKIVSD
jgi:predicted RNA-binding Zn-ribbon protein involved in translation (DUF1610 family)